MSSSSPKFLYAILAILLSGGWWYFGNGLGGDSWYLVWIAPIPVLIFAIQSRVMPTLLVSFFAYLLGRLSWFSYLVKVATIVPAIVFTIVLPLIFVLIVYLTRSVFLKSKSWHCIFAYPVFFTSIEFLLMSFSPDGTAGSIAYSQMNFLPIIQVASLTGILGIIFIICFIPSMLVSLWHFRGHKFIRRSIEIMGLTFVAAVLLFGILRLQHKPERNKITVGLVTLDEKTHDASMHPDFSKEIQHVKDYAAEIQHVAAKGAKIVVLPERALNINKEIIDSVLSILGEVAERNQLMIVTGYTNYRQPETRNSALAISSAGYVLAEYDKCHLVTGLENQFTPGNKIGLIDNTASRIGIAVCKDLGYPLFIRAYGFGAVEVLTIPAWDFVTDDWLHSRMAILRGVENGFSEIRTARLGRLTISDYYGRVNFEANASSGQATSLVGQVSLQHQTTVFSKWGNWFAAVILILTTFFLSIAFKSARPNAQSSNKK